MLTRPEQLSESDLQYLDRSTPVKPAAVLWVRPTSARSRFNHLASDLLEQFAIGFTKKRGVEIFAIFAGLGVLARNLFCLANNRAEIGVHAKTQSNAKITKAHHRLFGSVNSTENSSRLSEVFGAEVRGVKKNLQQMRGLVEILRYRKVSGGLHDFLGLWEARGTWPADLGSQFTGRKESIS